MKPINISLALLFIGLCNLLVAQPTTQRALKKDNDVMEYSQDEEHNYIVDFSYAGYKNGNEAIPNIPVVKTIQAISGDNTEHIQDAIDEVAALPADANGIRGAILLEEGWYEVKGVIELEAPGIVLRGVGEGDDPDENTVLEAKGNSPSKRSLIVVGTEDHEEWGEEVPGTRTNIVSSFLPAGSRSLEVEDISLFEVGDPVIVFHPSTSDWLASVNFGDTASDDPWESGPTIILIMNWHKPKFIFWMNPILSEIQEWKIYGLK